MVERLALKSPVRTLKTLNKKAGAHGLLMETAAQLFVAGVTLDWETLAPGGRRIRLPTNAFAGQRYWVEVDPKAAARAAAVAAAQMQGGAVAAAASLPPLALSPADLRDANAFAVAMEPTPLPVGPRVPLANVLVIGDQVGVCAALADKLSASGADVQLVDGAKLMQNPAALAG